MTNMLLVSNTLDNINVAWRHFANSEYNANATTNYDSALDNIKSNQPDLIVFYFSANTTDFMTFYRLIRREESIKNIPLLILADAEQQTVLSRYVSWNNAAVVGISINGSRLNEIIQNAIQNGFVKKDKEAEPAQASAENAQAPAENAQATTENAPAEQDQPKEPDYSKPKII